MSEVIINNTRHSTTIIKQIINLLEKGFNNEEISKQSDKLFGYNIQENVIENIMKKNHVKSPKIKNRIRSHWRIGFEVK